MITVLDKFIILLLLLFNNEIGMQFFARKGQADRVTLDEYSISFTFGLVIVEHILIHNDFFNTPS